MNGAIAVYRAGGGWRHKEAKVMQPILTTRVVPAATVDDLELAVPLAEALLEGGADVNAMHETRVTPLMYAAASGHVDAMRLLIDVGKVDVNELHTNGRSALLEAATGGAGRRCNSCSSGGQGRTWWTSMG